VLGLSENDKDGVSTVADQPGSDVDSGKTKRAATKKSIRATLGNYATDIGSLSLAFPLTEASLAASYDEALGTFAAVLGHTVSGDDGTKIAAFLLSAANLAKSSNADQKEDAPRKLSFRVQPAGQELFRKAIEELRQNQLAKRLVSQSLLFSLLSQHDYFVGDILRCIYVRRPDILRLDDKEIKFSDLLIYGSVDALRGSLVDAEIETFLRKSHAEQFGYVESKFGIQLTKGLAIWPDFIEITERRNLIAHADGRVSRQYLNVCSKHGVQISDIKVGDVLEVSSDYFSKAYECLLELGYTLGQVLWRKVFPEEHESADTLLISTTLKLIEDGRYALAARILKEFLFHIPSKQRRSADRMVMLINLAQSYKWLGQQIECDGILNGLDLTAAGPLYQFSVVALQEDYTEACRLFRVCVNGSFIKKEHLRAWPVFREFRKAGVFLSEYKCLFGEDYADIDPLLRSINEHKAKMRRVDLKSDVEGVKSSRDE
jgi:hypothetical protein